MCTLRFSEEDDEEEEEKKKVHLGVYFMDSMSFLFNVVGYNYVRGWCKNPIFYRDFLSQWSFTHKRLP